MIKSFFSTISFLTTIPTPKKFSQELKHLIIFFPLVGFIIGGTLLLVNILGSFFFPKQVVNLLIILSFVMITGGLHLDGLADTVDGFYAGKNKEDILRIMDDARTGAMGVIGIVLVLLSKFVLINNIPENIFNQSLFLIPVVGKWSMVLLLKISKSAKEDGLGNTFVKNTTSGDFILSGLFTFLITIFLFKLKGILILLAVSVIIFVFSGYTRKKIGGITGDTLGAINEGCELLTLFILSIK